MAGHVCRVDRLEIFVAPEVLDIESQHSMHERCGGEAGIEGLAAHHAMLTQQRRDSGVDSLRRLCGPCPIPSRSGRLFEGFDDLNLLFEQGVHQRFAAAPGWQECFPRATRADRALARRISSGFPRRSGTQGEGVHGDCGDQRSALGMIVIRPGDGLQRIRKVRIVMSSACSAPAAKLSAASTRRFVTSSGLRPTLSSSSFSIWDSPHNSFSALVASLMPSE